MILLSWVGIILGVGIIISLFFEEGREWWSEIFIYIFSFEWWEDIRDFFGDLFDNLGEFSVPGLIGGFAVFGLVYLLRGKMLIPFLNHMGRVEYLLWGGLTYVACFVVGYLITRRMFED